MFNERGKKIKEAGPSTPALILGLNGAPQAGESFNVMDTDKEAKEIANKREQLQREQELRTTKHLTLDEIGRRIAIGNFQELNVIVKGDVDGSIEALSDSLDQTEYRGNTGEYQAQGSGTDLGIGYSAGCCLQCHCDWLPGQAVTQCQETG